MSKNTENKHFYRLSTDTVDGKYLSIIIEKGEVAMRAAAALAAELGAARFTPNPAFLVGGIGQLYFEDQPDKDTYEVIKFKGKYFECYPNRGKEAGAKVLERILQLPVVRLRELDQVFGMMPQGALTPAFFDYKDYIYLASTEPLELAGEDELEPIDEATFKVMHELKRKKKEE